MCIAPKMDPYVRARPSAHEDLRFGQIADAFAALPTLSRCAPNASNALPLRSRTAPLGRAPHRGRRAAAHLLLRIRERAPRCQAVS